MLKLYANYVLQSSSKETKITKPAVVDIPSVPEPVVAKKNLFEAGDAWNQSTSKTTPTKVTTNDHTSTYTCYYFLGMSQFPGSSVLFMYFCILPPSVFK